MPPATTTSCGRPESSFRQFLALGNTIALGLMQEGDLLHYARGMHAYGNAEHTYDGPCRFWVELRKGETTPQSAFSRAVGIVNPYFLFSNSSEVNRILAPTE